MGFRFRKSASFGPLRINFSKSGVGYSVGGKGFRVTKKAGGGVRTTASIPGTGISYVTDHGSKKKSASSQGSGTCSNANSGHIREKALLPEALVCGRGNHCPAEHHGKRLQR